MSKKTSAVFETQARKVLHQLTEDLLDQEAQLFVADNVEPVHESRVAINKLRVALRQLEGAAPKKLSKQMQSDLRWFKSQLAPVRDKDVIQELLSELGDPPYDNDRPGISAIAQALAEERQRHLEDLMKAAQSSQYAQMNSDLESLRKKTRARQKDGKASEDDSQVDEEKDENLERNLAELIQPLYADFEKLRQKLAEAFDPAVMHEWRISAKKLRYALDFFEDLKPDLYGPLSGTLHELHDCTGKLHDIDVLAPKVMSLAAHWQMTRSPEENQTLTTGIDWVLFRLYQMRRDLMQQFYQIWATIASEEFLSRANAATCLEAADCDEEKAEEEM